MLPEAWVKGKVRDLVKALESGVSVNGEDRSLNPGEKGVLKVSAVTSGKFRATAAKAIISADLSRAKTNPKAGQVIISRSNTAELVGASAYIEKDYDNLYLPDKLWQTIPAEGANMRWLSYVLASKHVRYRLSNLATGSSGSMKNITQDELLLLDVVIPTSAEQQKIADILSTWDRAIEATERLLENSKQRKKALMQQLLTGKKRLPGFEGEWERAALKTLGTTFAGLSGKTKDDFGAGAPFITYMNVFENPQALPEMVGHVQVEIDEKQHAVRFGDIIFTTSSETPAEVGMSSVVLFHPDQPTYLNSFCFGFRLNNFEFLNPEFASYALRSTELRRAIHRLAQGATRYNLSQKFLLEVQISVPSLNEQKAISDVLSAVSSETRCLSNKVATLRLEKKALMQQLLTGKKRVAVDKEAA